MVEQLPFKQGVIGSTPILGIGRWPSGKAIDFDSIMRGFESLPPCFFLCDETVDMLFLGSKFCGFESHQR